MTITPDLSEEIVIEYNSQRFALPSPGPSLSSKRTDNGRSDSETDVTTGDSGLEESSETESADSCFQSGTQRTERGFAERPLSLLIGGAVDDIPRGELWQGRNAVVGGTIIIRGLSREEDREAIQKILALLVSTFSLLDATRLSTLQLYTIQSMISELDLLDTFRIPRELDPIPAFSSSPKVVTALNSHPEPSSSGLHRQSSHKERGDKAKGFFQKLGKDTKVLWDGLVGKGNRRASGNHEERIEPLEEIRLPKKTQLVGLLGPDISSLTPPMSANPLQSNGVERHLALLRLQEEDHVRRVKAQQEMQREGLAVDGLPRPLSSKDGTSRDAMHGRALGYRLGGDLRTGLGALAVGLDTLEGWFSLQRLETLYYTGVCEASKDEVDGQAQTMCQKPSIKNFAPSGVDLDETIQGYVRSLAHTVLSDSGRRCKRVGCEVSEEDHCRWWIHAGEKVRLRMQRGENNEGDDKDQLDAWIRCNECGKESAPRVLGEVTGYVMLP
jgi:1-phosphatidylinositol-3-phosphate 5-kinase